jgi:hypothetical protein
MTVIATGAEGVTRRLISIGCWNHIAMLGSRIRWVAALWNKTG